MWRYDEVLETSPYLFVAITVSVCDSPQHLIEATLDWLAESWMPSNTSSSASEDLGKGIDYILWTGDTARHDIDFTHPRNAAEIFDYNRWVLGLVEERFPGVPIVPNLGNNDIIPHNIMFPGPNSMTKAYEDIWQDHIPQGEQDTFREGGYYAKEVIEDDLAIISLNTLYWYDANAATRGCKGRNDPGSIELAWLEDTLAYYRNKSMQVQMIGHVPPTAGNYFTRCYERYTDIALRYQDTVVGQHFGHMNIDAWFLQEDVTLSSSDIQQQDHQIGIQSFPSDLRKDYDAVPTKQKTSADAYLAFFVAPSVVPTYLPTVRVWTYNTSRPLRGRRRQGDRVDQARIEKHWQFPLQTLPSEPLDLTSYLDDSVSRFVLNNSISGPSIQKSHRRPSTHRKKHRRRDLPRFTSPDSPSRSNTYLSLLGYSQWILELEEQNRRYRKESQKGQEHTGLDYQLEYTTYQASTLWSQYVAAEADHVPIPKTLLDKELNRLNARSPTLTRSWFYGRLTKGRKVNVPRKLRHLTDYALPHLSVDQMLEWARELAGNDKMWNSFRRRIYTETEE
jgi:endopolyphosphatase